MSKYQPSEELGRSGLIRYDGFIDEEYQVELKGERRVKVYKEMSTYPIIGGILFAIINMISQVKWRVDPARIDDSVAKDVADFVDSCRLDMSSSWGETISDHLSFLKQGFNYSELVYKRRVGPEQKDPSRRSNFTDNKIGWRKIASRSAETMIDNWCFDDEGGIQGCTQRYAPPDYKEVFIPIEKALLFRAGVEKNNPEGNSILRNAYRPHFFVKNIENIEAIGLERDLAGYPIMYVPPEILTDQANAITLGKYEKMITNIRRDEQEGSLLPSVYDANGNQMYKLELLNAAGKRNFDTSKIVNRYDQKIALTVLADFILLGTQNVGSFALAKEKISIFATALTNYVDHIANVYNRYAIPRLLTLNGIGLEDKPVLAHGGVKDVDLEVLGKYLNALTVSGMEPFPNEDLEKHLLSVANLPTEAEE